MSKYEEAKRLFFIGLDYQNSGNVDQAIIHYKKSLALFPDSTAMMNLGNAFISKNLIEDGMKLYDWALKTDPNNYLVYYNLGTAYEKIKSYKKAIESYEKAVEFKEAPLNFLSSSFYNMAICYHDGFKDLDKAMEYLTAANSLAPLDYQIEDTIRMYMKEIKEKEQSTKTVEDSLIDLDYFTFISDDHVRYENGVDKYGHQKGARRLIEIESHDKYPNAFKVTIYNLDGSNSSTGSSIQMQPKRMKIVSQNRNEINLRGFGNDQFGTSFSNYGITIFLHEKDVSKVVLHMIDRDVDIEYFGKFVP